MNLDPNRERQCTRTDPHGAHLWFTLQGDEYVGGRCVGIEDTREAVVVWRSPSGRIWVEDDSNAPAGFTRGYWMEDHPGWPMFAKDAIYDDEPEELEINLDAARSAASSLHYAAPEMQAHFLGELRKALGMS